MSTLNGAGALTDTLTATGQTRSVTLPDGRPAGIRKLTWPQMKTAAKAQTSEQVAFMREVGAELLKALRDEVKTEDAAAKFERLEQLQRAQSRQPSQYEMATTLQAGVVSVAGVEQPPVGTLDVLALDPVAAEFLHDAIVRFAWEVPGKNA